MLCRAQITCIAIAKCEIFLHYRDAKEISFYYFCNTKLCVNTKNTREFLLYCWNHVCKVNEWCLVEFFHREFRVSTQIMVPGLFRKDMQSHENVPTHAQKCLDV